MTLLAQRMLFRRGETASSIIAIAPLVILASMNSVINHVNSQAEALGGLVNVWEISLSSEDSKSTDRIFEYY